MRDVARINEIIDWLRGEWEKNPDYRLTQLIINEGPITGTLNPLWNLEDTYWLNEARTV